MNPLHNVLTVTGAQWRTLHRQAVAGAGGRMLDPDAERMAATDDLVALTVPALARLAIFAVLAGGSEQPSKPCRAARSRSAADVLGLLACALAADGRDHGYPAAVWLEHAFRAAHTQAAAVTTLGIEEMPLSTMVEASAEAVADVVIALRRDRRRGSRGAVRCARSAPCPLRRRGRCGGMTSGRVSPGRRPSSETRYGARRTRALCTPARLSSGVAPTVESNRR